MKFQSLFFLEIMALYTLLVIKKEQNLLKIILLKSKKILWKNNLEFLVQN